MAEPFRISIPDEMLQDLASRLATARLPTAGVDDWNGGMNPAYLRELVAYWRDGFDWRAQEALLNRFRHQRIHVDGTRIHFIHENGRGPSPLPILLTHGWPDSFFHFYKLIPLL